MTFRGTEPLERLLVMNQIPGIINYLPSLCTLNAARPVPLWICTLFLGLRHKYTRYFKIELTSQWYLFGRIVVLGDASPQWCGDEFLDAVVWKCVAIIGKWWRRNYLLIHWFDADDSPPQERSFFFGWATFQKPLTMSFGITSSCSQLASAAGRSKYCNN